MTTLTTKINMLPAMQELCKIENTSTQLESSLAFSLSNLSGINSMEHAVSTDSSYSLQSSANRRSSPRRYSQPSSYSQSNSYRSISPRGYYLATNSASSSSTKPSSKPLFQPIAFTTLTPEYYDTLVQQIATISKLENIPTIYLEELITPFLNTLRSLGKAGFSKQLVESKAEGNKETLIQHIAHAILQNFGDFNGETVARRNTEALREVISDLYQKFLKENCLLGNSKSCLIVPSPVPNWIEGGLSTFPKGLASLGANVSIVNVPFRYATKSAISWGCLGHEVAGHDILGAYPGALEELQTAVTGALEKAELDDTALYWSGWMEEATADVLAVLNMGPAAAFSLIGLLRTPTNNGKNFKLSAQTEVENGKMDEHPVDLIRGFLVAYAAQLISLAYTDQIMEEVKKDAEGIDKITWHFSVIEEKEKLANILSKFCRIHQVRIPYPNNSKESARWFIGSSKLSNKFIKTLDSKGLIQIKEAEIPKNINKAKTLQWARNIPLEKFKTSAKVVVKIIMNSKLKALGNRSFSEIRCWNNNDEKICKVFQQLMKVDIDDENDPVASYKEGYFAAHVVSAAVMESITEQEEKITDAKLARVFNRMISILKTMHTTNPAWQKTTKSTQ